MQIVKSDVECLTTRNIKQRQQLHALFADLLDMQSLLVTMQDPPSFKWRHIRIELFGLIIGFLQYKDITNLSLVSKHFCIYIRNSHKFYIDQKTLQLNRETQYLTMLQGTIPEADDADIQANITMASINEIRKYAYPSAILIQLFSIVLNVIAGKQVVVGNDWNRIHNIISEQSFVKSLKEFNHNVINDYQLAILLTVDVIDYNKLPATFLPFWQYLKEIQINANSPMKQHLRKISAKTAEIDQIKFTIRAVSKLASKNE